MIRNVSPKITKRIEFFMFWSFRNTTNWVLHINMHAMLKIVRPIEHHNDIQIVNWICGNSLFSREMVLNLGFCNPNKSFGIKNFG